jgi:hypothetical protein
MASYAGSALLTSTFGDPDIPASEASSQRGSVVILRDW